MLSFFFVQKKKKFKKLCPSLLKLVNLKPTLLGIGSFYKNLFCLRLKHYRVFKFVQRCWILDNGHQVIIVSCKWQGIITFPAWDQRIGDTYSSDQGCGNSYMLRAQIFEGNSEGIHDRWLMDTHSPCTKSPPHTSPLLSHTWWIGCVKILSILKVYAFGEFDRVPI